MFWAASNIGNADYCDRWFQRLSVYLFVSLSHERAVQKRLNGSTSSLGWRILETQETLYYMGSPSPTAKGRKFDAAFGKLLWPLVFLLCEAWKRVLRAVSVCNFSRHLKAAAALSSGCSCARCIWRRRRRFLSFPGRRENWYGMYRNTTRLAVQCTALFHCSQYFITLNATWRCFFFVYVRGVSSVLSALAKTELSLLYQVTWTIKQSVWVVWI